MDIKFALMAAGTLVFAGVSCTSKQDVPPPDDPRAQEWTAPIKQEYPNWQPTPEMPEGTAVYNAEMAKSAKRVSPVKTENQIETEKSSEYPVIYSDIPMVARVDIRVGVKDYVLDGNEKDLAALKAYFDRLVAAHKEKSSLIIYAEENIKQKKLIDLLNCATESGIRGITLVDEKAIKEEIAEKQASATGNKKEVKTEAKAEVKTKETKEDKGVSAIAPISVAPLAKIAVDQDAPAANYVVLEEDTLSGIALKSYKRAILWTFIYEANKTTIKNPNRLKVGLKIKIPALKNVDSPAAVKKETSQPEPETVDISATTVAPEAKAEAKTEIVPVDATTEAKTEATPAENTQTPADKTAE